jgi:histidine phosphotransfer protein HptB
VDIEGLAEEIGLERTEIIEIVELFIETTSGDLDTLEHAIQRKDFQTVKDVSHSIKGVSANFRFTDIHETAKGIEMKARENRLEGTKEDLRLIREKVNQIKESLLKAQH